MIKPCATSSGKNGNVVKKRLEISIAYERLDEGSAEERASFGLFAIQTPAQSLTEGFDSFSNSLRPGPLVSGYHVAEWFAWNWWRLRWEPRSETDDWWSAHRMNAIGEGYVWPNIEIWSDGVRTVLSSRASADPEAKPFRYVGRQTVILPSTTFEEAIDAFIPQIIERLRAERLTETNLALLWADLLIERADPMIARYRRLEALMGREPGLIEDGAIDQMIADAEWLGEGAVREVAAEHGINASIDPSLLTAKGLDYVAQSAGFPLSKRDRVSLGPQYRLHHDPELPAWRLGKQAAGYLRQQMNLDSEPVSSKVLSAMAGTSARVLTESPKAQPPVSFSLETERDDSGLVVLPFRRETGRRFALARILGDHLMHRQGALHVATHAATYRQKAQRSFAAELLAPIDAIDDFLDGDYSEERQQDAADYFNVSPVLINSTLKNHRRIDHDPEDDEGYGAAA